MLCNNSIKLVLWKLVCFPSKFIRSKRAKKKVQQQQLKQNKTQLQQICIWYVLQWCYFLDVFSFSSARFSILNFNFWHRFFLDFLFSILFFFFLKTSIYIFILWVYFERFFFFFFFLLRCWCCCIFKSFSIIFGVLYPSPCLWLML